MKVHFGQIYIQPGVTFPFSHRFQKRFADDITSQVTPSTTFATKYGDDWDMIIRISAKTQIVDNEIKGPTIFRKDKDVEYTVFLPFDTISCCESAPQSALQFLLRGCCQILRRLDIDSALLEQNAESMIESICSDPTMFA